MNANTIRQRATIALALTLVLSVFTAIQPIPAHAAASVTGFTVKPTSDIPGQSSSYILTFSVSANASVQDVKLTAPAGYTVSGVTLGPLQGFRKDTTLGIAALVLTVDQTRTTLFRASQTKIIQIDGIVNPTSEGPHTWTIDILDAAAVSIDTKTKAVTLKNIEILGRNTADTAGTAVQGVVATASDLTLHSLTLTTSLTSPAAATWSTTAGLLTVSGFGGLTTTTVGATTHTVTAGAGGVVTITSPTAATWSTTAGLLTVNGAGGITLDDTSGAAGIVQIAGGAAASDFLRLGDGTTPVTLQKTAANQLTITATDLVLSAGVINTAEIADDAVTSAKVQGSNNDNGAVRFQTATGTDLVAGPTGAFTPGVSSQAIATCSIGGTAAGATADTVLTLTKTGTLTIAGDAAQKISTLVDTKNWGSTTHWVITGATSADAKTLTCTATGTGLDGTDSDRITLTVLWFPE